MMERGMCALCLMRYDHYGNNPEPLGEVDDRVCDACNAVFVIPARMGTFSWAQCEALRALLGRATATP